MSRPAAVSQVKVHKALFEKMAAEAVETQKKWKTFRSKKQGIKVGSPGPKSAWYGKSEPKEALIYGLEGTDISRPGQEIVYKLTVSEEGPGGAAGKRVDLPEKQFELKGTLTPHFLVHSGTAGGAQGSRQLGTTKRVDVGEYEIKIDAPKEEGTYYFNVLGRGGARMFKDSQIPLVVAVPPKDTFGPIKFSLEADIEAAKAGTVLIFVVNVTEESGEALDISLPKLSAKLISSGRGGEAPLTSNAPVDYHAGIGSYEVYVCPPIPGPQTLELSYNGQRITSTKFEAKEGISVKESRAIHVHDNLKTHQEGNLQIEPRTAAGQPILVGGDQFEISCESEAPVHLRAYEGQRGQYLVRFTFEKAGKYALHIRWNGEDIGNSPITITVED